SIQGFIWENVESGATLLTDGSKSYVGMTDYRYFPQQLHEAQRKTPHILAAIKQWFDNKKELTEHLIEDGLVEYAAPLNWRSSFATLRRLERPRSYWDIIGRENPRSGIPTSRQRPRRRKTATGMREDGSGRG